MRGLVALPLEKSNSGQKCSDDVKQFNKYVMETHKQILVIGVDINTTIAHKIFEHLRSIYNEPSVLIMNTKEQPDVEDVEKRFPNAEIINADSILDDIDLIEQVEGFPPYSILSITNDLNLDKLLMDYTCYGDFDNREFNKDMIKDRRRVFEHHQKIAFNKIKHYKPYNNSRAFNRQKQTFKRK